MLDNSEMRKQILILESVNEYYGKFDAVLIAFFLNIWLQQCKTLIKYFLYVVKHSNMCFLLLQGHTLQL